MSDLGGAATLPLRFQVGARTLAAIPRRLTRVPLSLAAVLADRVPTLPSLGRDDDGYLVTSLPESRIGAFAATGMIMRVRQRYTRYHVDLSSGETVWEGALSTATRAGLKRKARKLSAATIERYSTPDEIAAFHPLARRVSALTYQERLLDAGLPADPAPLIRLAASDRVRAWLLSIDGHPIAYLCCTAEGDTLRYDHVGHDEAASTLSPGSVLQVAALRDLFAEGRFRWFDFTEGEGQHKRSLSSGGTACVDLLLLRPTLANRAVLAVLSGFDRAVVLAKAATRHPRLARLARRMRR